MCRQWRLAALAFSLLPLAGCGTKTATQVSSAPASTEPATTPADPEAREKAQSADNLRHIGRALLAHQRDEGFLPHTYATPWSQPLPHPGLSWRFALLPWLGRDDLRQTTNPAVDSPDAWQAPSLREVRIAVYESAVASKGRPGESPYRVFVGGGAIFRSELSPPPRLSVGDIKDPRSATILVVEAAECVPWPRPEELPYDAARPLPRLGLFADGFHALMADGSVRFVPRSTDEKLIRALVTADGGEPLDPIPGREVHPPPPR